MRCLINTWRLQRKQGIWTTLLPSSAIRKKFGKKLSASNNHQLIMIKQVVGYM